MLKAIKNIIIFVIVFAAALLILDRFVYYSESVTVSLYGYDNKIGRTLLPGNYLYTTEGLGMGSVNEFGYIGKPSLEKKKGEKLRIALIGDSYVESYQLFDRMYFGRIMEKELKNKYGIDADIMNFGRSGFTVSDMYAYYENFIKKFDPDFVMYFVENDDFQGIHIDNGSPYPYLENDSLKIHYYPDISSNTFLFFSLNKMSKYFPTIQMVRNSMNLNKEKQTPRILFGKFYEMISSPQENEIMKSEPDSTLTKIITEISANEKSIFVFRDKVPINPEVYAQIKNSGGKYIDVNDTLNAVKSSFNPYYWKSVGHDGHWNIPAHEVIGKFLANRVAEKVSKE